MSKFRKFQGGVERHIDELMAQLTRRGHDVGLFSSEDVEHDGGSVFSASAQGAERVKSAKLLLWNSQARISIRNVIEEFRPDILHFHSIYHHLSPSVLGITNLPSVMTLHDYKLSAPCYTLYREGRVCQDCVGRVAAMPAIRHKCISGSRLASSLCAVEAAAHRRRYTSSVDRFIVPSQFAFDVAAKGGVPTDRMSIVSWGSRNLQVPVGGRSNVVFFGGRLHPTKGVDLLVDAWRSLPPDHGYVLRIAGEGEITAQLDLSASKDPSIELVGLLSQQELLRQVATATLAVVPSLFPETMGLSAIEALCNGTPIISSGRGALADLTGPGVWTLPEVDSPHLRAALISLLIDGGVEAMQKDLHKRDMSQYTLGQMVYGIEQVYRLAQRRVNS